MAIFSFKYVISMLWKNFWGALHICRPKIGDAENSFNILHIFESPQPRGCFWKGYAPFLAEKLQKSGIWVFWRLVGLSIMIRETSSLKISTIATVQISHFLSKKSACHIIFSKRGNDKWLLFSLVTARLAVMVLCVDICAQVWVKYDFRLSSSSVYS